MIPSAGANFGREQKASRRNIGNISRFADAFPGKKCPVQRMWKGKTSAVSIRLVKGPTLVCADFLALGIPFQTEGDQINESGPLSLHTFNRKGEEVLIGANRQLAQT